MNRQALALAAALACIATSASAVTVTDLGPATLSYDASSSFGALVDVSTDAAGRISFSWTVPAFAYYSLGGTLQVDLALPGFTLTPDAGRALGSVMQVSLGDVMVGEVGKGAHAEVSFAAVSALDASSEVPLSGHSWRELAPVTVGGSGARATYGTEFLLGEPHQGALQFNGAHVSLHLGGGNFTSLSSLPTTRLTVTMDTVQAPVPEPGTEALLLAGLAVVGFLARRRTAG